MPGKRDVQAESILVIGADSLIGGFLADSFEASGQLVWRTTRHRAKDGGCRIFLDMSVDPVLWSIPPMSCGTAIICAAATSVSWCKNEPEKSYKINVLATEAIAKELVDRGWFVIFLSSNLVFDGNSAYAKITDPTSPKTEYGCQKAQAECQLLSLGHQVAVVRFSKVISQNMPLIKGWAYDVCMGKAIHPFSDMVLSPVPLWFAVQVLKSIAGRNIAGITQVSATQDISYEEVARYLARKLGAIQHLVEPTSYKKITCDFAPLHSTLDISRLQDELKLTPPDVWRTVDGCCPTSDLINKR